MEYSLLDLRILAKQLRIVRINKQARYKDIAAEIGISFGIVQRLLELIKNAEVEKANKFRIYIPIILDYIKKNLGETK